MQKDNKRLAQLLIDLQEIKLERKQNEFYKKTEDITEITNKIIDYENETQERRLEELSYKFFQDDLLQDYIEGRLKRDGAWYVIRQLKGLDEFAEWYYFDGYENLQTAEDEDVEDRLDEIIYEIENH